MSTTGVGGFVLGGGSGWLERKFGLACDNLVAVELVTADGETVRASEDENAELFWALHGGGGTFGVATSLELRLHPLASVTAALLVWAPEAGRDVVPAYRDLLESAPDEVGGALLTSPGPRRTSSPPSWWAGSPAVLVTYAGGEPEARDVMAPLLELGNRGEMIVELAYADMQSMLDDPPGYRNYWSAEYLASFPDEAGERVPCPGMGHDRPVAVAARAVPSGRGRRAGAVRLKGSGGGRLRRRELRPPGPGQGSLRPGQRLPPQPQHRARHAGASA